MGTQSADVPASHADLLETNALAFVATVDANGAPQVNPVWFGWDGTHLRFSHTASRQKYRNLKRDPRMAVTIVDPTNPYRYLELRGKVIAIDADPTRGYIDKMAKKYMGVDVYPWHQPTDERVIIVFEPERALTMG